MPLKDRIRARIRARLRLKSFWVGFGLGTCGLLLAFAGAPKVGLPLLLISNIVAAFVGIKSDDVWEAPPDLAQSSPAPAALPEGSTRGGA